MIMEKRNLRANTGLVGSAEFMTDETSNDGCGDKLSDAKAQGCNSCESWHIDGLFCCLVVCCLDYVCVVVICRE